MQVINRVISGVDMVATFSFPHLGTEAYTFGTVQTLTYSTFREKTPVRLLGRTGVAGYTRGPRTIAGTLVFSALYDHVIHAILQRTTQSDKSAVPGIALMDELPPFNITMDFINEVPDIDILDISATYHQFELTGRQGWATTMGATAKACLFGVEIVSDAHEISVENTTTSNVMQYTAQDLQMIHSSRFFISREGIYSSLPPPVPESYQHPPLQSIEELNRELAERQAMILYDLNETAPEPEVVE